jgi:hypothetical protein
LAAKDRDQLVVEVKEWGGSVMLTALSVRDRAVVLGEWARLGAMRQDGGDAVGLMLDIKLRLVALSITDEAGAPLFTLEDVADLAQKSDEIIGRISDAAITLNRFVASATEDAAKN